jgi:hypothetical protein
MNVISGAEHFLLYSEKDGYDLTHPRTGTTSPRFAGEMVELNLGG